MPEISLLTDSTTDLQSCKWIPSGIRYTLGPFFLLSSHALFRHQIQHHVKCQQLPHLQRLSLVFTPALLSCPPRVCPWVFSPFLKPFPLHNSAAAYLQHISTYGHSHLFTGRPLCASISYLLCAILLQPFTCRMTNHQLLGSARRSSWLKHHLLLHNKWGCWASVTILVNANRKKKELQTKILRIIYAWITGGKLSRNWMTARKDCFSFSGYN